MGETKIWPCRTKSVENWCDFDREKGRVGQGGFMGHTCRRDAEAREDVLIGILQEIAVERASQDAKWGWPRDHGMERWHVILSEEVGEVAEAILEANPTLENKPGDWHALIENELIQVAAVAVAMLQHHREIKSDE